MGKKTAPVWGSIDGCQHRVWHDTTGAREA